MMKTCLIWSLEFICSCKLMEFAFATHIHSHTFTHIHTCTHIHTHTHTHIHIRKQPNDFAHTSKNNQKQQQQSQRIMALKLTASDLNDFISPSQACIKPVEVKKSGGGKVSERACVYICVCLCMRVTRAPS